MRLFVRVTHTAQHREELKSIEEKLANEEPETPMRPRKKRVSKKKKAVAPKATELSQSITDSGGVSSSVDSAAFGLGDSMMSVESEGRSEVNTTPVRPAITSPLHSSGSLLGASDLRLTREDLPELGQARAPPAATGLSFGAGAEAVSLKAASSSLPTVVSPVAPPHSPLPAGWPGV